MISRSCPDCLLFVNMLQPCMSPRRHQRIYERHECCWHCPLLWGCSTLASWWMVGPVVPLPIHSRHLEALVGGGGRPILCFCSRDAGQEPWLWLYKARCIREGRTGLPAPCTHSAWLALHILLAAVCTPGYLTGRSDSGTSAFSWVNQSSRLSDQASFGRWPITLGSLLAHWRSSNPPEARRPLSLSTSSLASTGVGRLWSQLST